MIIFDLAKGGHPHMVNRIEQQVLRPWVAIVGNADAAAVVDLPLINAARQRPMDMTADDHVFFNAS